MRLSSIAAPALAAVLALAGCSPAATPTPPPDAATMLAAAGKASYPSRLEIKVGAAVTTAGTTTTLPDDLLTIDIDTAAGAGSAHLALPAASLGASGVATLAQLGVTGDSLTFDLLYDGAEVYARSPILPVLVNQLAMLAPGVGLPKLGGDTWARLMDEATLKQLTASTTGAVESSAPSGSPAPDELMSILKEAGATMSVGPQTTAAGGAANVVKIAVDPVKLKAYILAHADQLPTANLSSISELDQLSSISVDVTVDVATSRMEQVSFSAASSQGGKEGSFTVKVGIAEAPAGISFAAPSGAVDVPLAQILGPLIQNMLLGGG